MLPLHIPYLSTVSYGALVSRALAFQHKGNAATLCALLSRGRVSRALEVSHPPGYAAPQLTISSDIRHLLYAHEIQTHHPLHLELSGRLTFLTLNPEQKTTIDFCVEWTGEGMPISFRHGIPLRVQPLERLDLA